MKSNLPENNADASGPRLCFVLGITQRCGSNFLYRMLCDHPQCSGPGPIWEDHFVQYADLLARYTEEVFGIWAKEWQVETLVGDRAVLLGDLGSGIESFLRRQLTEEASPTGRGQKILLAKTPSVKGLEHFTSLFGEARLIIIVRDGRAVVESGIRSFDWNFESAICEWVRAAQSIDRFQQDLAGTTGSYHLLRYEDLVRAPERELRLLFDYLGVDSAAYDYSLLDEVPVVGSSLVRSEGGQVHWSPQERGERFDPIRRFATWTDAQHSRFNWLAGTSMRALGYRLDSAPERAFLNRLLDLSYWVSAQLRFRSKIFLSLFGIRKRS